MHEAVCVAGWQWRSGVSVCVVVRAFALDPPWMTNNRTYKSGPLATHSCIWVRLA